MSPQAGVYLLRAVTVGHPPGVGGQYATSAGIDRRIETAAQVPSVTNNQYWRLAPAGGDAWHIFKNPPPNTSGAGVGEPGFQNGNVHPHAPVILSNTASTYRLSDRGNNVYVISPTNVPTGQVGVDHVIGVSDENTLEIKTIPVVEHPPPVPGWELKPVH